MAFTPAFRRTSLRRLPVAPILGLLVWAQSAVQGQFVFETQFELPEAPSLVFEDEAAVDCGFGPKFFDGKRTGKIFSDFGPRDDHVADVATQADGKVVVVSSSEDDFAVMRFKNDGSVDESFHFDGKVTTDIQGASDAATCVAIQSDGKIVVAGWSTDEHNERDFSVVRYTTSGNLDSTFGEGGRVITGFGGLDYINDIVIRPNGKIVVGGTFIKCRLLRGCKSKWAVAQYLADGSLDRSFDGNGLVAYDLGDSHGSLNSIALHRDGKLLLGGAAHGGKVMRLNRNGSKDFNFGFSGVASLDTSTVLDLAVQGSGPILALNFDTVFRLDLDGRLDLTFGDGHGSVKTSVPDRYRNNASAIVATDDGGMLVAGSSEWLEGGDFAVMKFNDSGRLDSSFGLGLGHVYTDVVFDWLHHDIATSIALMPNGRFVVAGYTERGSWDEFAVVRYHPDGNLDRDCYTPTDPPQPSNIPNAIPLVRGTSFRGTPFLRGDTTGDGTVDITDAIATLDFLFAGRDEPLCLKALDSDDNGDIELTDANFTINFLFLGGTPLPTPNEFCGGDPTPDTLTCESMDLCSTNPLKDSPQANAEGILAEAGGVR